ncbi:hypothetical protein [Streptomyces sp. NPDC058247]|uniref:hypothetical protein n=1 Tax=Streptomyces sp. NPDC058247 TaxID=3346401 RepID=UPI0036EA0151
MQFGKMDGDGPEGMLVRAMQCIDQAADRPGAYRQRFDIKHVHLAWLGDHIEDFQSQGGANTWRTQLTLTEQICITRRLMAYAIVKFAPLVSRLTVVAVPGNHGEAVRVNGKGVTRYDDSHDTDALISVSEALALAGEEFAHVEVYVPDTDELTVVVDCSGTIVAHAHGHQRRPGKHFDWWRGQAFDKTSAMHTADLLVAGHLHHEFIDTDGPRTFVQVPAMESESTWWRHRKGTRGAPRPDAHGHQGRRRAGEGGCRVTDSPATDWRVLDLPEVVALAGRAARRVADGYEDTPTMEYEDARQEALIILAMKPAMVNECLAEPSLGLGVLYHRLVLDLVDRVKTEAKYRIRHTSYEAACDAAEKGRA